jgi:hypothetical protein
LAHWTKINFSLSAIRFCFPRCICMGKWFAVLIFVGACSLLLLLLVTALI